MESHRRMKDGFGLALMFCADWQVLSMHKLTEDDSPKADA